MADKSPRVMHSTQVCYSYTARELAVALGLPVTPGQFVVVEIDEDMVDVMVRENHGG